MQFNEKMKNLRTLCDRQPVHNSQYSELRLSGQASNHFGRLFFHRDRAATRAISLRLAGVRCSARAFPPRKPPSRPRATACGFFSASGSDVVSVSSPTERSTIRFASWFISRGREGVLAMSRIWLPLRNRSSTPVKLSHYPRIRSLDFT
jgi:hypothetical protein